jgi:hypothetical protein
MSTSDSKKNEVAIVIQAKDYSPSKEKVDDIPPLLVQPSPPTSPLNGPLHLERLALIQFFSILPRVLFESMHSTVMLVLHKTTVL